MDLLELAEKSPNIEILNSWLVTDNKLKISRKPFVAISGGSDSDLLMHLCATLDGNGKVTYAFFDTGLEFQATKNHIAYLQEKYGVMIETARAVKPIPLCVRQHGVPFLSKQVSEFIERLQLHNYKWEDKPFDELYKEYPKCKAALRWWCNDFGEKSKFNIEYNTWLKEFMIENPPTFRISNKCCYYAKKLVAKRFIEDGGFDLNISGVRKAEGGARSSAYKNCFSPETDNAIAQYRPLFWYKQETKREFEEAYSIKHSDCYEVWGLPRTGCSGCPFGQNLENELAACEKYEPKMYRALNKVFGESYEYTRKYREFQNQKREEQKNEGVTKCTN